MTPPHETTEEIPRETPSETPLIVEVPGFSRPVPVDPVPPPATQQPVTPQPSPDEPASVDQADQADPGADVDRTRLASPSERDPAVLVLADGARLTVAGDGVLGRNPAARVGAEVRHLVPVTDPTRSVSKTHLAFGLDAVGLWVQDLHSTNGTALVAPDGTRTRLEPGHVVHVVPGDVVVVGDVRLEVSR